MEKPSMGLIEFAARFVEKAREKAHEVPGIRKTLFTSRQSKAIGYLGIARIMRTREELGVNDLVNLAVITTPPEAQKYAEMIAIRILFGDEEEKEGDEEVIEIINLEKEKEEIDTISQLKGYQILLQDILDYLKIQQSVDYSKGLEELKFAEKAEEELFGGKEERKKEAKSCLDYAKKRLSYEIAGGRQTIIQNKIKNWKELFEQTKKEILRAVPQIDYSLIGKAQLLGLTKEIEKLSRETYVKNLIKLLDLVTKKELNVDRVDTLLRNFTTKELGKTLQALDYFKNLLKNFEIEEQFYAPSLKNIVEIFENHLFDQAMTLDDILYQPLVFKDKLDRKRMYELIANTWKYSTPSEMLKKTKSIDDMLGTNFSTQLYSKYKERFKDISLEDLLSHPVQSLEWSYFLNEKFMHELKMELDFQKCLELLQKLEKTKKNINHPYLVADLQTKQNKVVENAINTANSREELSEIVNLAREHSLKFDSAQVKRKGESIGLTDREIAKILGSSFEYIKAVIETEDLSFEETHMLLKPTRFSYVQIVELAKVSVAHDRVGALGALSIENLGAVAKAIPNSKKAKELFQKALGAGGGENLLYQWFLHNNRLPKYLRQIVKDAAKRIFIELAKSYASSLIGSSEAGPLPEGSIRPYQLGDDLDTIDIDETVEHILELGKQPEDVDVDDFIVRKTVTGRRCVIFLVDISGSMEGQPLASASLATAMLLFAFSRDELGVALFESDTHVICQIGDPIFIDEIVDEILNLKAMGGTQMQKALEWAEGQFLRSKSQDKMFIMVTDALIGDFYRCEKHLRNIADQGVTSVLIMPESTFGIGNKQSIIENANAHLITVSDWKKFPEIVSKVLSRT